MKYRTGRSVGKPPMPKSDLIPTPGQKGLVRASSRATAEAKARFLVALAECGSIAGAARACGRAYRTVHDWRDRDPAFAEKWNEALHAAVATLEREAWRRAVEGVEENQISAGKVVGTVRRYSDTLLGLLLRAHAPEKYGSKPAVAVGIEAQGEVRLRMIIPGMDDAATREIEGDAARLRFALPPPEREDGEQE